MSFDGTLLRGTALFNSAGAKFGAGGRAGGVFQATGADSFLATSGNPIGTGTIECWIKTTVTGALQVFAGNVNLFWMGKDASNHLTAHYGDGATEVTLTTTFTVTDGAWHHVALCFAAGVPSLYADGNRVATSATTKSAGTLTGFCIGAFATAGFDWSTNSYIDELRLSSTARYSGTTYTVPTAAFVPDGSTVALYHLETSAVDEAAGVQIAPNNAAILYSPGNWDITGVRALSVNAGAYLKTLLALPAAQTATLKFDMTGVSAPVPQIAYRVDQGPWTVVPIAATVALTFPAGNSWATHMLEVVVKATTQTAARWTAPAAVVRFTGITLDQGSPSLPTKRPLRILVFGDSITEGSRTLNITATDDTDRNDTMQGWAWQLTETMGAEVGVIGFGGQGIITTGVPDVPVFGSTFNLIAAGIARSFAPAPDLIVCNFGANDGGSITAGYGTVLTALLAATPASTIIALMRPFGGQRAADVAAAVTAAATSRVKYIDTTGWFNTADSADALHPYGYTNTATLSPLTAAALHTALTPVAAGGSYAWAA